MSRKLISAIAFVLLPSIANAQGYIEGSIGAGIIGDVDVDVDTSPSGTVSGDYGTELLFGAEAGVAGLGNASNIRFGVSWDHLNADLDSISVSGFGLGGTVSANCSAIESEVGFDVCSEVNESVNVIGANAYIDLAVGNTMGIQPYIGVGAGYAFFEDADGEFALSGTVGARVPLGESAYLGGRYRFQWISGPKDDFGIDYNSITVHGFSALIGFNF
jgi:opacity protein-like surface antigen